jgi:tRNA-guanine family transglycosylase
LRRRSAEGLREIGFDGYAIGGLAVGEPVAERLAMLDYTVPLLPEAAPRLLASLRWSFQRAALYTGGGFCPRFS